MEIERKSLQFKVQKAKTQLNLNKKQVPSTYIKTENDDLITSSINEAENASSSVKAEPTTDPALD